MSFNRNVISTLILILFVSCEKQTKFNKEKWNERNSMGYYDFRKEMLDDLLNNNNLRGKKLNELHEMFGDFRINDTDNHLRIYFNIITDFGHGIDPVYTKDLVLELNQDSIVTNVHINELKR